MSPISAFRQSDAGVCKQGTTVTPARAKPRVCVVVRTERVTAAQNSLEESTPVGSKLRAAAYVELTVIRVDVPRLGGSPESLVPFGFPYLAWTLGRALRRLGVGVIDAPGVSRGGALAQQVAFQP